MKLLHLEDNDSDAELVATLLCCEWPECRITRLSTGPEFKEALCNEKFDLVVSDYTMPGFDGLSALDAVRSTCPGTPFVFLSGTIGEERAIEALRHGATDYVLKDSPRRLLAAVRGALQQADREAAKRRAEESLRKSQEQFRQIAETIEDFIVLLDERGYCLYGNPAYWRLLGESAPAAGTVLFDRVHPDDLEQVRTFLRQARQPGARHELEYRLLLPGDQIRHVEARVCVPKSPHMEAAVVLLAGRDVTERKAAEESHRQLELELQRSQRIEGLGMLAGGIAHDLNNVLSPILMSVGLLRPLAATTDEKKVLDTVAASAVHGADLVRQILLFARGGEGQRVEVHLDVVLSDLEGFLKTSMHSAIQLSLALEDRLWPVIADVTQIKQVLMNLCVNARDAMPEGGCVWISAVNVNVADGTKHGFHGEIPAGRHVRLSVADSGTGIPPEVLEKIFDPFFTTKELGKGTGLGLSTIAGIVKNHDGAIQVETAPSRGTTFHIYLPAVAAESAQAPSATDEAAPRGEGQCILVIDDDEGIRFIAEHLLAGHGYEVCSAADGRAGLKEFERGRDRIELVICDDMMPGLRGTAVLEQIHAVAPEVKLISMSGHLEEEGKADGKSDSPVIKLGKPLNSEALLRAVGDALRKA